MTTKPLKILVVDDEPDLELLIRQKFRKRIRAEEVEFSFARDGIEALDKLRNGSAIDIVLTDINMPRMDGLSLLNKLQELDVLLKVVIVSAYGDMDNIRTAMNRGAFDFVTKPIDFEDLEITIEKTRKELDELRKSVTLQARLRAIDQELEIARQIQTSSLPSTFPAFPERDDIDLFARMVPAQEVGGDFYDFFLIDDHHLGFVVGDVSGKGLGAALLMAITRTMIRATAMQGLGPAACLTRVNQVLYPETMRRMFVTAAFGVLDTRTHEVRYAVAGHFAPAVLRADGSVEAAERPRGLALCLVPDFDFGETTLTLARGERVVLYSDGVTEAGNLDGEMFGEERLFETLRHVGAAPPSDTVQYVLDAVKDFSAGRTQTDDVTLFALTTA